MQPLTQIPINAVWVLTSLIALIAAVLFYRWQRDRAEAAVPVIVDVPLECKPGWKGQELEHVSIKIPGSTAIQCYAPATGQALGLINPVTADGIDRAVSRGQQAQRVWVKTSFPERRRVLRSLLRYMLDHQDEIVTAACLDSGKTKVDAIFGEILVTAAKLRWTIAHGERALKTEARPTNLLLFYKSNEVRWEPLGVVAACVSWNYPFHNLMGPIISSIFAGNAIIVKNSENTAWSSQFFTKIVRAALSACGHPPDLVQGVTCWPSTADHLTSHTGISHITFIGSRPVAHAVCTSAAKALIPVVVELGGKDAALVLDDPSGKSTSDSEMKRVASILMRGIFQSSGQNCIGIERVIATPTSYDRLVSMLTPRVRALRVGNPLTESDIDVGAMISDANFSRLESLISDAVTQGATLVCGGKRYAHPTFAAGSYFTPTLLIDVTPSTRIANEELFGPIALLMRASSIHDAVAMANSTPFALGASIFCPTTTPSARAAVEKATRDIEAGMVAVNDFGNYYVAQLPFGGVKGSGYGRFGGEEGLRGVCNPKSVCVDRWPGAIKTAIPAALDYPMLTAKGGVEMGMGVVEVGFGDWREMGRGIGRMVGWVK